MVICNMKASPLELTWGLNGSESQCSKSLASESVLAAGFERARGGHQAHRRASARSRLRHALHAPNLESLPR